MLGSASFDYHLFTTFFFLFGKRKYFILCAAFKYVSNTWIWIYLMWEKKKIMKKANKWRRWREKKNVINRSWYTIKRKWKWVIISIWIDEQRWWLIVKMVIFVHIECALSFHFLVREHNWKWRISINWKQCEIFCVFTQSKCRILLNCLYIPMTFYSNQGFQQAMLPLQQSYHQMKQIINFTISFITNLMKNLQFSQLFASVCIVHNDILKSCSL